MATGLSYRNTITAIPNWVPTIHIDQPRGYGYETDSHFVHFYGREGGLWVQSSGLTATEAKSGTLDDWVDKVFGAQDKTPLQHEVGTVVDGVWRPGLYYEDQIFQALDTDRVERRGAEQSLYGLVDRLNELLLYIEPEGAGLDAYGPKSRELLILASTEAENTWAQYMRRAKITPSGQGYSTNDYVRLHGRLHLAEYEVSLAAYSHAPHVRPFLGWDSAKPTQSLAWYDAYNKAKHERSANLPLATLLRCIEAVAANLVMFSVRFGPYSLYQQSTPLTSLVNHLFALELVDCDPATFYVPLVELPPNIRTDLVCGETKDFVVPWTVKPLVL
jgi:hypothetical protein